MEKIKLNIKLENNWLEATWTKEVTTISDVERDGEIVQEESVTTEQLHCESFSGHQEHIAMLEAKAVEFGTSLDEYAELINQAKEAFVMPTDEELLAQAVEVKKQEALTYLSNTDWYVTRKIETGVEIPLDVLARRAESRLII